MYTHLSSAHIFIRTMHEIIYLVEIVGREERKQKKMKPQLDDATGTGTHPPTFPKKSTEIEKERERYYKMI